MSTSHDLQNQAFLEPYVPAPHEVPKSHWSISREYLAYLAAREAATTRLAMHAEGKQVWVNEDDPEVKRTHAAFLAAFPPEPEVIEAQTPRQAELQAAQLQLRLAVRRMKGLAHTDRILKMVSDHLAQ
jgi:DUF971 family protein